MFFHILSLCLSIGCMHSRPIDDISTWTQYGESVCWVAADWEDCCAPKYGSTGNPECWIAFPLSYEKCCLERWKVCDAIAEFRERTPATSSLSSSWLIFYESCGRGQELLNLLQRLWSAVGFLCTSSASMNSIEHGANEACSEKEIMEQTRDIRQELNTQRSALDTKDWLDVLDAVQLPHINELNLELTDVVKEWSPQSFAQILPETDFSIVNLREKLHVFRDHLEQFRDSTLNAIYMHDSWLSKRRAGCGEICNIDGTDAEQNTGPLRKRVNCNALLNSMVANHTESVPVIPPPSIPSSMMPAFTMNGQVAVLSHSTIRQALGYAGGVFPAPEQAEANWMWSREAIEKLIAQAREYKLTPGPHSLERVKTLTDVLAGLPEMVGQHWIVWGDQKHFEWWKPWMESLLLSFGVGTVSSMVPIPSRYDVSSPHSPHPQLRPITMQKAVQNAPFHGVVLMGVASAGVGRHGDNLNPNEDLQQAAAAWCLLQSGGILIAPTMTDTDLLRWPLGRVYGPKRWPHLVANFELLRIYDGVAAVLRKP